VRRHRDGGIEDLVRNTIIWIAIVIWLAWSYIVQAPPADPYADSVRNAFTIVLAIVIPLFSAIVIIAWVGALRERHKR
jgi:hypothetical protein